MIFNMTKSSDKYSRIGKVSIYQAILAALAFVIPFTLYIKTLEPKLVGGDTSWFAVQVPKMEVLVPTGYPSFSIFAKLFTFIPIKDLAYRLNLLSAVFASLAVLFLYLALSRYLKNAAAAFAGALTFAFIISFWSIANRFELDAINSFFLALLLFSIFQYRENPRRKFAYFVAACFGLSLTDHPLTLFIIPPLFLYFLMIKPQVFKSLKTILLCIMYFILPLSLYAFLPVRSLQGYGSVTTLR